MTGLRDLIRDGRVHVMDGAIGTLLYDRGVFVNVCYDELNLTRPDLVEEIHRDYVAAGAEILETNTFGANPVKLSGFGLEGKTEEINRAAAELAKRAANGRALVVGALGPLGIRIEPWGPTSEAEARDYFQRQATGLVEGGVDGFLLETFSDLNEVHQALAAIGEVSDLPTFAQVTVEEGGTTSYGSDVETVARKLEEWGADVIGVNCSVGPVEALDAVERMARVTDRPLCVQPNAGIPRLVGDRKMYLASPSYMARYARRMVDAGARFVGGCCGTTPEHIREIWQSVHGGEAGETGAGRAPGARPHIGFQHPSFSGPAEERAPAPLAERSALGRALAGGAFTASVELLPPRGADPAALIDAAERSQAAGADAVALVDASRGPRRIATIPAAMLLAGSIDAEVIVHYTCRDRNMLRMISDLLGAAAGGIRNLLVVSGDPPVTGPYPDHTMFSDIDAIGLTNVLRHLNAGMDPGGQVIDPPTRFVVGVALNQGATDLDRERRRYGWKVEAGADFAISQPVFDPEALIRFLDEDFGRKIPVVAGLWPLATLRDAEYLDQEVPGVQVPAEVLERMEAAEAKGGDAAKEEGFRIMEEVMDAVLPRVQGVHVTAPRGVVEPALEIVREAKRRGKEAHRVS